MSYRRRDAKGHVRVSWTVARYLSCVFDYLADFVGGMVGSTGAGSNNSKARAAYKTAWKSRGDGADAPDWLVSSMKAKNVYGIYTNPDQNPELAPYFAAWADDIPPDQLKVYVRQSRRR